DQGAGDVRRHPRRVLDHLKNRKLVVVAETRLVKGFAVIAQGVVHVDQGVAILVLRRVHQAHETGEVLGDVGSRIDVVPELLQGQRKRVVSALRADIDLVFLAAGVKGLRRAKRRRDQPNAEALLRGFDFYIRGNGIRLLVRIGWFGRLYSDTRADSLRRSR